MTTTESARHRDGISNGAGITLLDDERVRYDLVPAWTNWASTIVAGVLLLPFLGVGFLVLCGVWLDRRHTRYVVTNERVIAQHGVFSRRTVEYRIAAIEAIYTEQSWIERYTERGTVGFRVDERAISYNGISEYDAVADAVRRRQRALEARREP